MESQNTTLRNELERMLRGGHAHVTFDQAIARFPQADIGKRPKGQPHSAWELLEHLRIAQNDILGFSLSAEHVSPPFPEGHWPASPEPPNKSAWKKSVALFREDLERFIAAIQDPKRDLYAVFPWGDGQSLLREALLLIDHNSYHVGQLMTVRKTWEAQSR